MAADSLNLCTNHMLPIGFWHILLEIKLSYEFTMPVMVNIYIFEEMALRTLSKPTTSMRYIDDSFIMYSH